MLTKATKTPYPLIDQDPHFTRVVRYFRPSDYVVMAGATAAFPGALLFLDWVDPSYIRGRRYLKGPLILGTTLGLIGGFLFAYQRSSFRFWGWTENVREEAKDLAELSERARLGKPLYGESSQPEWVQTMAAGNSTFSALKFGAMPMVNLVNHKHHGTDPAKYGVQVPAGQSENSRTES